MHRCPVAGFVQVARHRPVTHRAVAGPRARGTGRAIGLTVDRAMVLGTPGAASPSIGAQPPAARQARTLYLGLLTWAFTLFNSVRVIAYLPTMWAIHTSGDSTQHSLWTWLTWFVANATMAAWLYEQNGRHLNRAIAVNIGNASMCLSTVVLILVHRF